MKYLISVLALIALVGCTQFIELKSDKKAQIYDNNKLIYESDCVAIANFKVNEKNMGVKNHSYVFKKTTCK